MTRGLFAAAELAEAHAATADYSASHHERLPTESSHEKRHNLARAEADHHAAEALRSFAKLLRAKASGETTDRTALCPGCAAKLAEDSTPKPVPG